MNENRNRNMCRMAWSGQHFWSLIKKTSYLFGGSHRRSPWQTFMDIGVYYPASFRLYSTKRLWLFNLSHCPCNMVSSLKSDRYQKLMVAGAKIDHNMKNAGQLSKGSFRVKPLAYYTLKLRASALQDMFQEWCYTLKLAIFSFAWDLSRNAVSRKFQRVTQA